MMTLSEFRDAFASEVGPEVAALARAQEIDRWFNAAQRALGVYREMTSDLAWLALASTVALPTDFVRPEQLLPDPDTGCVPSHRVWGDPKAILFVDPANVTAGSAKLFYWAAWPKITSGQPSLLPDVGDDACLSYALYRFYKRLASSRADYRKYSTVAAANGVDIEELDALSERHYNDFLAIREELQTRDDEPLTFWEG